jgi:hypothetical protein
MKRTNLERPSNLDPPPRMAAKGDIAFALVLVSGLLVTVLGFSLLSLGISFGRWIFFAGFAIIGIFLIGRVLTLLGSFNPWLSYLSSMGLTRWETQYENLTRPIADEPLRHLLPSDAVAVRVAATVYRGEAEAWAEALDAEAIPSRLQVMKQGWLRRFLAEVSFPFILFKPPFAVLLMVKPEDEERAKRVLEDGHFLLDQPYPQWLP